MRVEKGKRMTQHGATALQDHEVVSHEEWIAAGKALLTKEKEFTHRREELARQRRALPWERVNKEYVFDGPNGKETLSDLFEGRSQLIVYHFMFSPEANQGCAHCSFWADHYDATLVHLNHRDVSFVVISRAPIGKIEASKRRMGWRFKWVSSGNTDFNYDFQASFRPEDIREGTAIYNYRPLNMDIADREGISLFYRDESGQVFHTYSTYARGIDMVNATTSSWTWYPRAATSRGSSSPRNGFATTTATTTPVRNGAGTKGA
jgi:predicted dithiol-disulfide oxidoreductase (DUF899 family)